MWPLPEAQNVGAEATDLRGAGVGLLTEPGFDVFGVVHQPQLVKGLLGFGVDAA